MPATPDTQDAPTRWPLVWLAVLAGVIAAGHVGKLPPALPFIRAELDMGLVSAGWVVSTFNATAMMLGIAAGALADRVGHLRLAKVGLGLLAAGGLAGALAQGTTGLLAARLVEGLGFVSVAVSAPALIAASARGSDRRLALGLWGAYMPAGAAAMMLVAPGVLEGASWRALWVGLALCAAIWIAALAAARRRMPAHLSAPGPARPVLENARVALSVPGPWIAAICFGLYAFQWISLMVWLPTFLIEQRQSSAAVAAVLTALVVLMNVPGNLAAGWLLHRGAARWSLVFAASAVMAVAALGIFAGELPDTLRYGLCLVFSLVGGLLPASLLAAAPVLAPSAGQVGVVNGMLVQGSNLGQFFGPPAVALVVSTTGAWEAAIYPMVGTALACAGLALVLGGAERRAAEASARLPF